ncbi:MAG: hypothetical protein E3J73_03220 [Candidatus Bathyarchaeum sp.]|nr:MAG: hypothetical protein E3J73_03220 [Candidatus Bathyarchaeum sp.]
MGIGLKTRKSSLITILLVLLVSLFLLSVLSNILTGYPERPHQRESQKEPTGTGTKEEPAVLLFKVSPVIPQLYCRVSTADYYTGLVWLRTTDEKVIEEFPQVQDANTSRVFTIEINTSQRETLLPIPSSDSALANLSLTQNEGLEFYVDTIGNVYKVITYGQAKEAQLVYNVTWRDVEVDDKLILLDNIPEELLNKYLQLPDISAEVWKLAKDLEDPSYSILDQILADVQYLRTSFVYDVEARARADTGMHIPQGSNVFSYIQRRKGICIDAATALAIILRIQKIPARISIGYKPGKIERGKLLYYTTGGHAVTEVYLSPYGWIQFDATPPLEENPLVNVLPFKKVCSPGSRLFYQLSITNRRDSADDFKLFVDSRQKWNVAAAPKELSIGSFQTADALLEVIIPEDADLGEKDVVTITVASLGYPEIAFSILAIVQAENISHISTTTTLGNIDEAVIRGYTLRVNGTILTANDEKVDNMTVFIFLTKSKETEGVIVGKGYSKQGDFQIESVIPYLMEIGNYKVIPISLGTTQYAPSSSASIIRVRATTRIELGSEEQFLLGYGAIHGHLLWDNGTGFAKASISLNITSLATPLESWQLQNLTFKDGTFRIETAFEDPGVYEVEAIFSGNEYVLGSNATRVVELKRGLPTIQIFGGNIAVRGEVFNITVTIQYQDIRVWGEPATVTFDNQLLATIETRDNGSCTWSFLVDSEETLGPHIFIVALKKGSVSAVHKVAVKSKTRLTTKTSNIAGGMFLLFSTSISDDHDLPIQRAEIVVDDYGLSWKTDKNGNLTFLLDTIELWPANLLLTARFEGSESYLPVTTEKEVVLEPIISLPFFIPLVSPILFVMVFVYAKHIVRRSQAFRQTSDMEVVKERVMVEEEPIYKPQKMQPLKIVFPDIGPEFPNVWGIRAKLHIEIVLDKSVLEKIQKRDVEVLIDEETVASVRLSQQGRAELSHMFIKNGEHQMRVILPRTPGRRPWNAEIKLRVVDYGEEIIRLYNESLVKLTSYGIHPRKEMTAREIESLILKTSDFSPEALRKVTICFEKAEYSNHLATRKDYETMYLSLKGLNIGVE